MLALQHPPPPPQPLRYIESGLDNLLANGNGAVMHLQPQPKPRMFPPTFMAESTWKKKNTQIHPRQHRNGFVWNKSQVYLPLRKWMITRSKTKQEQGAWFLNFCSTWFPRELPSHSLENCLPAGQAPQPILMDGEVQTQPFHGNT